MKLFYKVFIHLSLCAIVVLGLWAIWFYRAMVNEINDETDDSLEGYSEYIIKRSLAGDSLPSKDNGSNNQYFLIKVDEEYALSHPIISYKDEMVYIEHKRETEPARVLTTIFRDGAGEYYQLEVSIPTIEKADLLQSIFYLIILLYAALLVTFLFITTWVYRKSMRPLYVLLKWLESNRLGDMVSELQNNTETIEFRRLNEAVQHYAEYGEEVYQRQKQFIANASHELQTPLAICANRLEILMDDESLSEHQMGEIAKTLSTIDYATKLNRMLLLLSKIENSQFKEIEEVDVKKLIEEYVEDYKEVYEYKGIETEVVADGECVLKINATLATVLLTNLLKNAYVHNCEGGKISIRFSNKILEIANTGITVPLDPTLIFERFYRGEKKEGSTGLGLAIVKAICDENGYKLEYLFEKQMHLFRIDFR